MPQLHTFTNEQDLINFMKGDYNVIRREIALQYSKTKLTLVQASVSSGQWLDPDDDSISTEIAYAIEGNNDSYLWVWHVGSPTDSDGGYIDEFEEIPKEKALESIRNIRVHDNFKKRS